jgi:D-alanyl-D-alanine carboxypeptidase
LPFFAAFLAVLALGLSMADPASAAVRHRSQAAKTAKAGRIIPSPAGATDPTKDAALIVDGFTGKVLYARNETALRHPASLTKMMTLYLLFEALRAHRVSMETQMPVSFHASQQKPTKLSLRPGQTINVDTAIRAIVIRSANDVAVVIAEALGGTESHFAEMMTEKARQLGMKDTNYHNASGLPDPLQITTATDLAILAHHLAYDFPQYFPYFGTAGFTYNHTYWPTHDNLIGRYQGADGIKTGFTGASGFNLASSVVRDGVHLIGIVMGGRTAVRRDLEMMHLLDVEFAQISANPALVARGTVPWQTTALASATPSPSAKDFVLPSASHSEPLPALSALPPPVPATDDEDTAEARRAPDENFSVIHAESPQPVPVAQPSQQAPQQAPVAQAPQPAVPPLPQKPSIAQAPAPIPAIRPLPRPDLVASDAPTPAPRPAQAKDAKPAPGPKQVALATPAARVDSGEGDVDQSGIPGRTWTIQIGAFADQALAKAKLDAFASKASDVVGQAARIVAPMTSRNGHTIYRARFGLYAESEARAVCGQLTQRGQTCFAVASR